jgi:hypothetical protein
MLRKVLGRKRVTIFSPDDYHSVYPVTGVSENPHSSRVHIEQWREDAEYRKVYPALHEVCQYQWHLYAMLSTD